MMASGNSGICIHVAAARRRRDRFANESTCNTKTNVCTIRRNDTQPYSCSVRSVLYVVGPIRYYTLHCHGQPYALNKAVSLPPMSTLIPVCVSRALPTAGY